MREQPNKLVTAGALGYSASAQISTQMVQLVLHYTGRGPTKARTTLDPNFVLVVLDDTLTRSERSLLAAHEEDLIRQQRRRLHELMRDEAVAIVERVVGQRVRAFLGDVSPPRRSCSRRVPARAQHDYAGRQRRRSSGWSIWTAANGRAIAR